MAFKWTGLDFNVANSQVLVFEFYMYIYVLLALSCNFPVTVEHGANNAEIMGFIILKCINLIIPWCTLYAN